MLYQALPHFDWFSFSEDIDNNLPTTVDYGSIVTKRTAKEYYNHYSYDGLFRVSPQPVNARAPFLVAYQCEETKMRISFPHNLTYVHLEFPGTYCDILTKSGFVDEFIQELPSKLSRVDFAVDIECDTQPADILQAGFSNRIKTTSDIKSDTGATAYIGSWSSDRLLRVYRYSEPHPRAKYLRFEWQFRRHLARPVVDAYLKGGYGAVLVSLQDIYKLEHPVWLQSLLNFDADVMPLTWDRERKVSKTMQWLNSTVISSIRRMVDEGEIIDPIEWLTEHVESWYDTNSD